MDLSIRSILSSLLSRPRISRREERFILREVPKRHPLLRTRQLAPKALAPLDRARLEKRVDFRDGHCVNHAIRVLVLYTYLLGGGLFGSRCGLQAASTTRSFQRSDPLIQFAFRLYS